MGPLLNRTPGWHSPYPYGAQLGQGPNASNPAANSVVERSVAKFHRYLYAACVLFCGLSMWVLLANVEDGLLIGKLLAIFAGFYGGFGLVVQENAEYRR